MTLGYANAHVKAMEALYNLAVSHRRMRMPRINYLRL